MGFSEDLANAIIKLRKNIDESVDVKKALRLFAEDVEAAAKTVKAAAEAVKEGK